MVGKVLGNPEFTKPVVHKALVNAFTGENLGELLNGLNPIEIQTFLSDKQKKFSASPLMGEFSKVCVTIMRGLVNSNFDLNSDVIPIYENFDCELEAYYANNLGIKLNLFLHKQVDTGVIIPLAYALGFYATYFAIDFSELLTLFTVFVDYFHLETEYAQLFCCVAFIVYSLCNDGYFCADVLHEVRDNKLLPPFLEDFWDFLIENKFNVDVLALSFFKIQDYFDITKYNYSSLLIMESLFYMTRVSTGYQSKKLLSLPKYQLFDLFLAGSKKEDKGFTFCGLCSASEHGSFFLPLSLSKRCSYKQELSEVCIDN